jgi:RND family efflux transporter MFP subunit
MSPSRRRALIAIVTIAVLLAATGAWWLSRTRTSENPRSKTEGAIPVVTAEVERRDVPVRLRANGSVIALQSVDLRAQITGTVRQVHITEGQFVRGGDLLVSLDSRAQDANVQKAAAQVEKDRSDLATATRNLDRQRELFDQQFISRATLDVAQSKVDTLTGQLAVDQAALEAARVSRAYTEIRATFAGRTGAIGVRPGSVVQPNSAPLVTVIQIDPIDVAFTLPQKELAGLQRALAAGPVSVEVRLEGIADSIPGRISFVDNTVDTATGTIRVKAEFANPSARLWPGMFVNVALAPRMIEGASVVPAQAVQTGPDSQFVYIVGTDRKVVARPVTLSYVEEGRAVVDGIAAGARIVVEGAQNLRPGSVVSEAGRGGSDADQAGVEKGASKKNDRAASEPEKAP